MPPAVVTVSKSGPQYTISVSLRSVSESELTSLLGKVFDAVNPAASLMDRRSTVPEFQALYQEGPLLFKSAAIDPQTRETHYGVGGLVVSAGRLSGTLDKLRELGFEVDDRT